MIGAERHTASMFAAWLMETAPPNPNPVPILSLLPINTIKSYLPDHRALLLASNPSFSHVHQDIITPTDIQRLNPDHRVPTLATFADYIDEVTSISRGVSIYSDTNIRLLKFIQRTYFACPNHGQFVEGGVKDTGLAGQTGAEERRRNNVAIIRSHTVEETNKIARKKQVHKIDDQSDHVPSGSKLTSSFLDVIEEQFNRNIPEDKIKVAHQLLSRNSQYKKERQMNKVNAVMSAKRKRPNVAQMKRGIDYTSSARGLISYGTVYRNIYIEQVKKELEVRGVEIPEDAEGIKSLLNLLKADEKDRHNLDAKAFKPLSIFVLNV